jgi:hypothetical protein
MQVGTVIQLIAKNDTGREIIRRVGEIWVIKEVTDTEITLYSYKVDGNLIIARHDDKDVDIKL